ncbi:MAG: gliding motility-associated protein GldE [Muribaculaceae bacterium]|nr:gliding motility-associated protein GldE [Muribaculaceae bacterium]
MGSIVAMTISVLGLFLSAFNSGSEIAYFSLTKENIASIVSDDQRERITRLLENPEKLLATILIGNNLVNVMIVVTMFFGLEQVLEVNSAVLKFLIQTVFLTFLILLFGEVIPKLYASTYNVSFAQAVSIPLSACVKLLTPLSALMVKSTGIVGKVVTKQADEISTDDLSRALEASDVKNEDEKELLEGILSFGNKTVSEIMRPRIDVVDIDIDSHFDEVVKKVIDTGYSRMPVYDETPDNIKGILYAKDLLPYIGNRPDDWRWQSLMRTAYFVPETRMIDDLLEDFRKKKMHMAVIVDEYGCTQGIATLEDVLEEIVGDIDDEYDTEEKFYTRLNQNTYAFDAKTQIADFCRVLDIDEDSLDEHGQDAETLAGLLLDLKGDFLKEQEVITYGRFTFTVLKVERYRIAKVKVTVK